MYGYNLPPHTREGRDPFGSRKDRCLKTNNNYSIYISSFLKLNHIITVSPTLYYITFMDIILTKICKFLNY